MGYVLHRGQLCFHAMFADAVAGRSMLLRGWLLGVTIAAVGLSVLFATPLGAGLDRGLPFAPVGNIAGGLLIGLRMVVARSCVSGLFAKLGSGMLGTLAGLAGWAAGELLARMVPVPGPVLLPGGDVATVPGVLGLPRAVVAVAFLVVVVIALRRRRIAQGPDQRPALPWRWDWPALGVALGAVTILGWVAAAAGGSSFGPGTVGAVTSVAVGAPDAWLIAFLAGIVVGAAVAGRTAGGFAVRGEQPVRYLQLALGGVLLGAGGWIAGGCNLGHGLSGVAQLGVSSWVVVAAIAAGVWGAGAGRRRVASVVAGRH
jgi:uncharacterized membrane protein YedE/YeeE